MKRRILIAGGIGLLMVLLAGAAFVGGRLMNGGGLTGILPGGPGWIFGDQGERGSRRINIDDILPAKELPQTPAEARGVFDHRQGNSIFIGTGNVSIGIRRDDSGNVVTGSDFDGPVVEIVVTAQTKIYKDVTMQQYGGVPPEGQKIQQVVEPGSLDEFGEASAVSGWGRKTDSRIIAEVVVFNPPAFINK
jgi:hypothetical protein